MYTFTHTNIHTSTCANAQSTKTQWSWHGYHRDERPWKVKFQERVTTDRNWLHGKPCISTLAGHTGVRCGLRYNIVYGLCYTSIESHSVTSSHTLILYACCS